MHERRKTHCQYNGRTVGIRDNAAFPTATLALAGNHLQMTGVDLRHKQRDVRLHAMVLGVRDHQVSGLGKSAFDFGRDSGIHGGKHQFRRIARHAIGYCETCYTARHHAPEAPTGSVLVALAGGAVACAHPSQFKPRVVLEELHEVLAHHAGGAENADWDLLFHLVFLCLRFQFQ